MAPETPPDTPQEKITPESIISAITLAFKHEYPNWELAVITHRGDTMEESIKQQKAKIQQHPAGTTILAEIEAEQQKTSFHQTPIKFLGIGQHIEKGPLPFQSTHYPIAGIIINFDLYDSLEIIAADFYKNIWQALRLHEDLLKKRVDLYSFENDLYLLNVTPFQKARRNMLGDSFAAIAMELTMQEGMIQTLAKLRCVMSFKKNQSYAPMMHPYPIALDATQIVFNDLKVPTISKKKPISSAYEITQEIDLTCSDSIISQWQKFIRVSEKMVWAGAETKHILGASIYTCEDSYNRSTAYLVSDILAIEPAPLTHFTGHNPFAGGELQELAHNKALKENYRKIIQKNHITQKETALYQNAIKQCQNMLNGNPIGWAAPALLDAYDIYKAHQDTENIDDLALQAYTKTHETTPWQKIRDIHEELIKLKKQGENITITTIIKNLQNSKGSAHLADKMKALENIE